MVAANFQSLLSKPAGEAEKPKAFPAGDYQGVIKGWETGDNNKNKTPYIRFTLGLVDWPESVEHHERHDNKGAPLDLSKRQLRRDYYMTEDAQWRLDELIRSCGIDPTGQTYAAILPHLMGKPVLVEVTQRMIEETNETVNQVNKITGLE